MARITFCGGVRNVTGSSHLIQTDSDAVLLDCGLFQGKRHEAEENNRNFAFPPNTIKAALFGHAHIDHIGNFPRLVKEGFRGKINCTEPSTQLAEALLTDTGHLQQKDAEYLNSHHVGQAGYIPIEPLYTEEDVPPALERLVGHPLKEWFPLVPGMKTRYHDAGHILGSAFTEFEITQDGKPLRLAYLVDFGRRNLPILEDPQPPTDVDYVIIESTYGNRLHDHIEDAERKLREAIHRVVQRKGKIIIPAFALERTQEILFVLAKLRRDGKIPHIPIWVDSPLAQRITNIFKHYESWFDEETQKLIRSGQDPFGFEYINFSATAEESMALDRDKRSSIIISASGMCEAGRVLHHLRKTITDPRNMVIVVGFMAEYTLGRKIVDKEPNIPIFGVRYPLRAEVVRINAFSGHADRDDLVGYLKLVQGRAKGVIIVHGEVQQSLSLAEKAREMGFLSAVPARGDSVRLTHDGMSWDRYTTEPDLMPPSPVQGNG